MKKRVRSSHVCLLLELDFSLLLSLGHHVLILDAHNTTTPVSSEGFVVVELSSEVLGEGLEVLVVFLSHIGNSQAGSSLLMNKLSKSSLALDEAVGDTLLSAESREEDEEFDGINVVSHNDELCLAFFDESGHVVETELENERLSTLLGISTTSLSFSFLLKSGLLFLLIFRLVFSEQFKKLRC